MYCAFLPTSQRRQTEHEGIHVCLVPLGFWNLWVRIMYSYSICFQRSELFQKKSQYFCSICFCARISKSNIKSHSITAESTPRVAEFRFLRCLTHSYARPVFPIHLPFHVIYLKYAKNFQSGYGFINFSFYYFVTRSRGKLES